MFNFTLTIDEIINEYGINIFDFEYIFTEFNYYGKNITKEELQNMFIEYYRYYPISFETIQRFKFELKRKWIKNITIYNKIFEIQPKDYKLYDKVRDYITSTRGNIDYSDTPNEPMIGDNNYLTNKTLTNSEIDGKETLSKNEVEKYSNLMTKLKNGVYEFFDLFDDLFSTLQQISTYEVKYE